MHVLWIVASEEFGYWVVSRSPSYYWLQHHRPSSTGCRCSTVGLVTRSLIIQTDVVAFPSSKLNNVQHTISSWFLGLLYIYMAYWETTHCSHWAADDPMFFTKASEASWSYSCDSKVSFDRVQILTPDFSGRSPPPPSSSPLPTSFSSSLFSSHLPSLPPPSSQVRLRPVVALWHAVSVAYLAAALAHSHCLTVSLSLSHLSHLSHLFLISLISLSALSLSLSLSSLSLVFPSLFSFFSRRRIRAKSHI